MKYWDTSALLRAWKEGWAPAGGITRAHAVAEWMAIQTGRGLVYERPDGSRVKHNLSPGAAVQEARRVFERLGFVDLTGAEVLEAVEKGARDLDVKGPAVHDFLHVCTAERHEAGSIVTLNLAEFSGLTRLRLELPAREKDFF